MLEVFSKKTLLRGKSVDNRPLVDLSYWAKNTYPETYSSMTELDQEGIDYLNSVRGTNMYCMFGGDGINGCYNLASIDVSNWNTSNVTDLSFTFYDCGAFVSLDLSNWDTSNVTNMNKLFTRCNSLQILNVSNWDTSKVTNMYYMFGSCVKLTNLDVSNWDTSNVTNMKWMFKTCFYSRSPTSLDLSKWSTNSVTNMNSMFSSCNVTVLDVSGWDTAAVTDMGSMFDSSYNLKYLIIGSSTFKFQMKDSSCGSLTSNCKILVPSALLSTYQNATNWSSKASQFDAIENYTITRSNGQVTVTPK